MRLSSLFAALGTLIVGGGSLLWYLRVQDVRHAVEKQLAVVQDGFTQAGEGLIFRYEAIESRGYPFKARVALIKPALERVWLKEFQRIEAPELGIEPLEEDASRFRVVWEGKALAISEKNNQRIAYSFHLDTMPELYLRTPSAAMKSQEETPAVLQRFTKRSVGDASSLPEDIIHEFSLILPRQILLSVQQKGEVRQASFQFPHLPVQMWLPLRYQLSRPYMLFFYVLEEMMATKEELQ